MNHNDIHAAWQWQPPSHLCSYDTDTGIDNGGTQGDPGQGPGAAGGDGGFGGNSDGDIASVADAGFGRFGMQFLGQVGGASKAPEGAAR